MGNVETDLHEPVKNWLISEKQCIVKSEVHSIDMVGLVDPSFLIAIEMKLKLNLEVINQAVERQGLADLVYIAVVHDFKAVETKRFKMTLLTLKRLNIGLLLVNFRATTPMVTEVIKPESFDFQKSRQLKDKKKMALIREFNKRHGDFNKAGSTKVKLMTAYKEQCLLVAHYMHLHAFKSAKEFVSVGLVTTKVSGILNRNFYKWFERIDKGKYQLTNNGIEALEQYKEVVSFILNEQ